MASNEQWDRDLKVQVGPLYLEMNKTDFFTGKPGSPMKVNFSVDKTKKADPNFASIMIYNLGPDKREMLEKKQPLILEGGYKGMTEVFFSGEITYIYSNLENSSWITKVECGDGEREYRSARVSKTLGRGVTSAEILTEAAEVLGVGIGNLPLQLAKESPRNSFFVYKQGITLTGRAVDIMDKYLSTLGLEWSIQDGQLSILSPEETTMETVLSIGSNDIVGSPEKNDKDVIKFVTLFKPGARPGRRILLNSRAISGMMKIESVSHAGDTTASEWYSTIECKELGTWLDNWVAS